QSLVQKGQAMAFSMGNLDDTLKQRFQSYADFAKNGLPDGQSFSTMYQGWSDTNRDTISSTLKAAGYTSDQFATEEDTMRQLRQHSQSAEGQKQALQVGHEIAAQQVEQMQKLRGLVSQQMTMMGTWYQSEQTARDHTKAASDQFFKNPNVSSGNGQDFKPQW
ncbi:P-type conjugative transfer protein TrbJ, partial [Labrenzia sp. MBR-25]